MKKNRNIIFLIYMSLLMLFVATQAGIAQTPDNDNGLYQVKVGDTAEYNVLKLVNASFSPLIKEDGTNFTVMQGNRFKINVTALNSTGAFGTITIDNNVSMEIQLGAIIIKVSENRSFYDDLVASSQGLGTTYSLDGDILTEEITSPSSNTIFKYNVVTGWLEYLHTVSTHQDQRGVTEIEYQMVGTGSGIPGFETVPLLLGIIVVTLLHKKRKQT